MLYEFALLPDVVEEAITGPNESQQRELVEFLRRVRENAMLVDIATGSWSKRIFELVTSTSYPFRSDIVMLFEDLSRCQRIVVHKSSEEVLPDDWLDWANSIRSICCFDGIIQAQADFAASSNQPDHIFPFPTLPSISDRWYAWQGKRSQSVRKCRSEFESVLRSIFRHAQRVDLVDPHFDCDKPRYKETLYLCIDLMSKGYAQRPKLVIHTRAPVGGCAPGYVDDWRSKWYAHFRMISTPRPIILHAFLWKNREPDRFHNRYVFTDQLVGIQIGYGLDCHSDTEASPDDWQLMDVDAARKEWQKFTSAPLYEKLADVKSEHR